MKPVRASKLVWLLIFVLALQSVVLSGRQVANSQAYPEVDMLNDRWGIVTRSTYGPIAVDGIPNEPVWAQAAALQHFKTFFDHRPAEHDTVVKVVYDASRLYISLQSPLGYDSPPKAERVFVVLADPGNDQKFYTIPVVVTLDSHPVGISLRNWTGSDPKVSGQQFVNLGQSNQVKPVVNKQPNGSWTAEMAVPWSVIGSPQLAPGAELRMNVIRYYGPDSPYPASSWVPIRTSTLIDDDRNRPFDQRSLTLHGDVTNEGRLGSLYLEAPPSSAFGSPAEAWKPEDSALQFRSFGEKALTFAKSAYPGLQQSDIAVVWTSPSGERTEAGDIQLGEEGQKWRIGFSHPAPLEDGLYSLSLFVRGQGTATGKLAIFAFDRYSLIEAGEQLYHVDAAPTAVTHVTYAPPSTEVQLLLQLVPDRIGFFATGVPHNTQLGFRSANYTWSVAKPWAITSADALKLDYPNDTYRENKSLTVTNKLGEPVEYPYYEDGSGNRYFLSAHLWHQQRLYAVKRTKELAATDPLGAARLLYQFSKKYAGWVRINDTIWNQYPFEGTAAAPYAYYGGMWDRWTLQDLVGLRPLADAFAEVDKTDAFELLSAEAGEDVRDRIVDGMLLPSIEGLHTYTELNSNVEYSNWIGLIQLGKALKEPRYIHEAVGRMDAFSKSSFLFDGFWKEITLSYHNQTINGVRGTASYAAGWTDPAGYLSSRSGQRFDNFDPSAPLPQIGSMLNIPNLLAYPDGRYFPVNDTWAFQIAPSPQSNASLLMPAAGIAKMVRGTGTGQSQLYMTFSPNFGHDHKDPLNLALYGEGQELLPDIGYTHTFYRQWTLSTLGHNTVVVDGKDAAIQGAVKQGGSLSAFNLLSPSGDVQAMGAREEQAYPGVSEYAREPWFVGFDGAAGGEGYVVDLFRVAGGGRHEYTLNGDANRDATLTANVPLVSYGPYLVDGTPTIIMPQQETDTGGTSDNQYYAYTYVRNVQTAEVPDGEYELTMTTKTGNTDKANLHVYGFAGSGDNRMFIGQSPSLRATRMNGLTGDTNTEAVSYTMPKFVLRKEGDSLQSQFIHVMEPYAAGAAPRIDSVNVLKSDETTGEAIIAVSYGDTTDIILSAPHYAGQPLTAGDLTMNGKMGFIRLQAGVVTRMYLAGGALLQKGSESLTGAGPVAGDIRKVNRNENPGETNGFVTTTDVPSSMVGRYMLVTHPDQTVHAYPITGIARDPVKGETTIDIGTDPGFAYTGEGPAEQRPSQMFYYPATKWKGTHTFEIDNVASK
ncbi:heparinase II/III family protein [Paenibacillus hodogayensis]|uniref:Heparinase II/III family protein n=1 Tax=Paenibacillus hodogayensis TaxID=279208 RepID=A0ABV5W4W6_9BACL